MPLATVPWEAAGQRLDGFLAAREEVGSRARAERLIDGGGVLVDGEQRPKSFRLAAGAEVSYPQPEQTQTRLQPIDLELTVLHRDEHLLASIDAALLRIDDGSYGVCERCGSPISPDRLAALPYATKCIECKRLEERG